MDDGKYCEGNCVEIPLTTGGFFRCSPEDAPLLARHKWTLDGRGYVVTTGRPMVALHRLVIGGRLQRDSTLVTDHKDRDKLHNCRDNLRWATPGQNVQNCAGSRSGLRGVHFDKRNRLHPWVAKIECKGMHYNLGCFADPIEAARVYNAKAIELFGPLAYVNPLPGEDQ